MSYKVLYRKYRPNSFNEVIGEQNIIDNLKQSIINNSFSHAYLFTGPRGTGKTSTAKVLAKAINCMDHKNGEPCNRCSSCTNFTTNPDIIEIDAASNNGVDEIRELRNNITLAPTSSKYKIYIIDEVHMLTSGAFNALLKTLEEPPSHAIFILATTEVYKVPITILSRCQRYDFQKLNRQDLINHLKKICEKEKIEYEDDALEEIYELSDGCVRDALSILDQLSKSKEPLTLENILKEYNSISNNTLEELLKSIKKNDPQKVIEIIKDFENSGMNPQKAIQKMINFFEKIALSIKLDKDKNYSFEMISQLIRELNQCYIDARINKNVYSLITLSFLEQMNNPTLEKIEKPKIEKKEIKETSKKEEKIVTQLSITDIRINNCFANASKEDLNKITELWNTLENNKISSIEIKNYKPVAASSDHTIFIAEENSLANLFNIKHADIEKMLKKNKINTKIIAITNEDWKKEKEKYKSRLKAKIPYTIIEEPKIDDDMEIKGQIETLFTEKVIEIS